MIAELGGGESGQPKYWVDAEPKTVKSFDAR